MKQVRSMSQRRVFQMVKEAKKHNLKRLKVGDLEIEFNPEPKPIDNTPLQIETKVDSERMPTDEEFLFMSSPAYDAMLEERK